MWKKVTIVALALLGASAAPAEAATTSTAPYASSGTHKTCDANALSCTAEASADHNTGRLAVDVAATGAPYYESGACIRPPFDPRPCPATVSASGGFARGWIIAQQSVPFGVSAVTFTVAVETGPAAASGAGTAVLSAWASQANCGGCSGSTEQTVVSGVLNPSAPAASRTLEFTFRSTSGPLPSGPISVTVNLAGDARGVGSNEVRASALVTSVSSRFHLL
jgi:hypothetical protein